MEKDDRQLLSKAMKEDGVGWKPYNPRREMEKDMSIAATLTRKANMTGVCALSRRLMATERARALGRKPVDFGASALELEAKRWVRENVNEVSSHRISPGG